MVDLSVEDGTRRFVSLGRASLLTLRGAAPLAGLSLLRHIAERTSLSDRPPVAVGGEASLALLAQDTLQAGYQSMGAGDLYQPVSGRLSGMTPFSAAAGAMPIIHDENVSASILVGDFGVEAALLADVAERQNAFLLGASTDIASQAALFASAEELLIGEELFATECVSRLWGLTRREFNGSGYFTLVDHPGAFGGCGFEISRIDLMRYIAAAIAIVAGLIVLIGYFVPALAGVQGILLNWAIILAGVAALVGVFNLISGARRQSPPPRKGEPL